MATSGERKGFHRQYLTKHEYWEVREKYTCLTPWSSGAFAKICSADIANEKTKVTIDFLQRPFFDVSTAKRAYRVLRTLKQMKHENLTELLDVFTQAPNLEEFETLFLVTTHMPTNLLNVTRTQRVTDQHIQFIVYGILRGLKYLHSAGIIHYMIDAYLCLQMMVPHRIAVTDSCDIRIMETGYIHRDELYTQLVAAQWYRAPEIYLELMDLTEKVDLWSVGCIMAEMITGSILFPGHCYTDQLSKIITVTGTPDAKLLDRIEPKARKLIESFPVKKKQALKSILPGSSDLCVELLEKLLVFDPESRISAEQALAHPYLAEYADPNDEPTSQPFDDSFMKKDLKVEEWKRLVFEEIQTFIPPDMPKTGD